MVYGSTKMDSTIPLKYQQPEPIMASVLQENEFLRFELEA
jgi:hypothetical protein